jgi:glycosyltransferase involved in cell wall biosynthesis
MLRCHAIWVILLVCCNAGDLIYANKLPEKPIVVMIPSYNNQEWYRKNLDSVRTQDYTNYRIVYIDDCSPDGTAQLVKKYMHEYDLEDKMMLVANFERVGATANWYNNIIKCRDHELLIMLDGDDWFPNNQVLKKINEVYQNPDIWMTYGRYTMYPSGTIGYGQAYPEDIIDYNAFRPAGFAMAPLRTFYVWLFKNIVKEDLMYQGDFFQSTCDQAILFPMIEMAGHHHKFISEVMYIYNVKTTINDAKVDPKLQCKLSWVARSRQQYARLSKSGIRGQGQLVYRERE